MKTKTQRAAPRRAGYRIVECVDALREHCANARALAALLELCQEVDAASVDQAAVGGAARLIIAQLESAGDWVGRLQEAAR